MPPQVPLVGRAENPMAAGLGSADSAPASPMEKYFTLKDSYARAGKPWDWRKMRDYVLDDYANNRGWSMDHWTMKALAGISDSDVEESPERARLIRMDDANAKREQDAARRADLRRAEEARVNALGDLAVSESDVLRQEIANLREENAAMLAKMDALLSSGTIPMNTPTPIGQPAPEQPAPKTDAIEPQVDAAEAFAIAGKEPTLSWTRRDLLNYATASGIVLESRLLSSTASKAEILEGILAGTAEVPEETEAE